MRIWWLPTGTGKAPPVPLCMTGVLANRVDVERILPDPAIPPLVQVSGQVHDVDTGGLTTIVEATSPTEAPNI